MPARFDPSLYLITDRGASGGRSLRRVVAEALEGGVTAVQLRDKTLPAGDLATICRALLPLTRRAGVPLIVNDRIDVARAAGADGVHLGGDDLPLPEARRLLGPGALLGATAANVTMARDAAAQGADYLGVGPFRGTPTKPGHAAPLGESGLARVIDAVSVPVVAIGGLDAEDADAVVRAGASGMAVVRAVCGADAPRQAAAALREALEVARRRR